MFACCLKEEDPLTCTMTEKDTYDYSGQLVILGFTTAITLCMILLFISWIKNWKKPIIIMSVILGITTTAGLILTYVLPGTLWVAVPVVGYPMVIVAFAYCIVKANKTDEERVEDLENAQRDKDSTKKRKDEARKDYHNRNGM